MKYPTEVTVYRGICATSRGSTKPYSRGEESVVAAAEVYCGSDSGRTKSYLSLLKALGQQGNVAADLFRAQKYSSRAKVYRSKPYRMDYSEEAYRRKAKALKEVCDLLAIDACGFTWGWRGDKEGSRVPWILYIDLPKGQASFHSIERFQGPRYPGQWDLQSESVYSVLTFCDLLTGYDGPLKRFCPRSLEAAEQQRELAEFRREEETWKRFQEEGRDRNGAELLPDCFMRFAASVADEEGVKVYGKTTKQRLRRIINGALAQRLSERTVIARIRCELRRTSLAQVKTKALCGAGTTP